MHNRLASRAFRTTGTPTSSTASNNMLSVSTSSMMMMSNNNTSAISSDEIVSGGFESAYIGELLHSRLPIPNPMEARIMLFGPGDVHRLDTEFYSQKPDFFRYAPVVSLNDEETDAELRKVNRDRTWKDVIETILHIVAKETEEKKKKLLMAPGRFRNNDNDDEQEDAQQQSVAEEEHDEKKHPQRSDSDRVFHMGFPSPPVMIKRVQYATFHVGLPQETVLLGEWMKKLHESNGCIRMSVPKEVLAAIADNENLFHNNDVRYHWKPLHIRIIEERNRLPITFNLQMSTRIPESASNTVRRRQQWISPTGPNCWGADTLPILNYVTYPGTTRTSSKDEKTVYVADEHIMNSIEFNRWMQVDELELDRKLRSYLQGKHYWVEMPDVNRYIADDVIQFVVATEMERLSQLCDIMKVEQPQLDQISLNRYAVKMPKDVLDFVLQQKLQLYNKSLYLMRLEDIEFTLTPVRQNTWKADLSDAQKNISRAAGFHESQLVSYSLKVEIAYENYTANAHFRNKSVIMPEYSSLSSPILMQEQQQQPRTMLSPLTGNNNTAITSNWNSFYDSNVLRR